MAAKKAPSRFTLHVIALLSGDKNAALICPPPSLVVIALANIPIAQSKQQIPQKSDLIDAPLTILESAAAAGLDRNPFFFPCQAETDLADASCLSDPIFLAPPIV